MRFSANLGFLWTELDLPEAIRAAHRAGFDAVELHWPYETDPEQVRAALAETGLPVLGLNTVRGNAAAGENGLAALPGREQEARAAIDQAIGYAEDIGAQNIHVMGGNGTGRDHHDTFIENLRYACAQALGGGKTILIEPLSPHAAPGYFLNSTGQAIEIMNEVGAENIALMFDCFHVQLIEGDLSNRLATLRDRIGHIQFAAVPDRGAPDHGEINYDYIFELLSEMGWDRPLGAEYKPNGPTEASLGWLPRAG